MTRTNLRRTTLLFSSIMDDLHDMALREEFEREVATGEVANVEVVHLPRTVTDREVVERFVREGTYPTEEERDAIRNVLADLKDYEDREES